MPGQNPLGIIQNMMAMNIPPSGQFVINTQQKKDEWDDIGDNEITFSEEEAPHEDFEEDIVEIPISVQGNGTVDQYEEEEEEEKEEEDEEDVEESEEEEEEDEEEEEGSEEEEEEEEEGEGSEEEEEEEEGIRIQRDEPVERKITV